MHDAPDGPTTTWKERAMTATYSVTRHDHRGSVVDDYATFYEARHACVADVCQDYVLGWRAVKANLSVELVRAGVWEVRYGRDLTHTIREVVDGAG